MEVWTFLNKKTGKIIRYDKIMTDDCFDTEYFFIDDEYAPIWFVETKEEAEEAYKKFIHPQYSQFYKQPSTNKINIDDFEICKFKLEK